MLPFKSSSRPKSTSNFFFVLIGICVLAILMLFAYQVYSMRSIRDDTSERLQQQLDLIGARLKEEAVLIEKYVKLKEMYYLDFQKLEAKRDSVLEKETVENLRSIFDDKGSGAIALDKDPLDKAKNSNVEPEIKAVIGSRSHDMDKHPILLLSDSDLGSTSLSTMMTWYGVVQGGGTCEGDFGNELVNRWRQTKRSYCSSQWSNIDCFLVKQTRHNGEGDNICLATGIGLKIAPFNDPNVYNPVMSRYVASKHEDQAYIHFRDEDALIAKCDKDSASWPQSKFPGWNADWMFGGLDASIDNPSSSQACDVHIDCNALIIQRDTFANFFHSSEDFVNAFLAMAILEWNRDDTQILLTDLYPHGPFWDIWDKVFHSKNAPMTAWELKQKYGDKTVCFNNMAVGIYGPAAPITVVSWTTPCYGSSLVKAYSDLVIRSLELQSKTIYSGYRDAKTVVVTWMARRSSVIWPERNFCGDDSYFKCDLFAHLGTRALGRVVKNEADVMKALKALESMEFANGYRVKVQDADYNLLSFKEQIEMDLNTDIMVGPHGAGLTHTVFLPDRGWLVELSIDGSSNNKHFQNLSKWSGRNYVGIDSLNPVDVNNLVKVIQKIVSDMKME